MIERRECVFGEPGCWGRGDGVAEAGGHLGFCAEEHKVGVKAHPGPEFGVGLKHPETDPVGEFVIGELGECSEVGGCGVG